MGYYDTFLQHGYGDDASKWRAFDDALYRVDDDGQETPIGATPSDPNKKNEHKVLPSELTLNGIVQNIPTDQGPDDDDAEGGLTDDENSENMMNELYTKPSHANQLLTQE